MATQTPTTFRMPAEWEPHDATWIAWPHEETDFPGKLAAIDWVYVEIVRLLRECEQVEVLCHTDAVLQRARECLEISHVPLDGVRFHRAPTDRSWLRDSVPTGVLDKDGALCWIGWQFNAWAKYDNFEQDALVPEVVAGVTQRPLLRAKRPDGASLVLEGGAIETDGQGTLIVTEECLLSEVQQRNPGLTREDYERLFNHYLGIQKTIWLSAGCAGDDTHGHIDDICRFIAPGTVVLCVDNDATSDNYASSQENLARLTGATDAAGRPLKVVELPYPEALSYGVDRLPASYANFYFANGRLLVPTFNDRRDAEVLTLLQKLVPNREVRGVYARDLVLGQGTLHCLTQQQPSVQSGR
ncbi:MAG: agmatine deiminase family protein [Bdellovibrionales bacterium]|nr:agmatine deiminase family protein [Bdellovibrionales bacterium]